MTSTPVIHPDGYQGECLSDVSLSDYTTWRVGGKTKRLYKPQSIADLSSFLNHLSPDEPLHWLGLGSNSLIRDTGFSGTVILTQGCLKELSLLSPNTVRVEAGVSCATMARFCARQNLGKSEFWAGIPGTMGGALRMNAGCFDGETWDNLIGIETMTRDGTIHHRQPDTFQVEYRQVQGLQPHEWFIAGTFELPSAPKEACLKTIKTLLERRAKTQPTNEYNCGSVFRNPPGKHAARLIEECGLKGLSIGHAKVSTKHANFIINENGEASSNDIESLIKLIQKTVQEKTNISLHREIHIIGDPE